MLISDVVLPDGSGMDFVAELRERAPAVAVLVISGHPMLENSDRRIEKLADAFLPKPFTQEQLSDAIAAALQAAGRRQVSL